MSYPITATNAKVTIRSLAANSPEHSVPLMAAVTHILNVVVNHNSFISSRRDGCKCTSNFIKHIAISNSFPLEGVQKQCCRKTK